MIRCTIELLPGGDESRRRVIGLVEMANTGVTPNNCGAYFVVLKKTPPFSGALRQKWRSARLAAESEDEDVITGNVVGFHRERRGVYDLLYRALKACGLEDR